MGFLANGNHRTSYLLLGIAVFLLTSLVVTRDHLVKRGQESTQFDSQINLGGVSVLEPDSQHRPQTSQGHYEANRFPWDDLRKPDAEPQAGKNPGSSMPAPEYAAVITETDPAQVPNLAPVMVHYVTVLGPKWPVILYTLEEKYGNWTVPPAFQRLVDEKRIRIRYLPPETGFPTHESVSVFLVDTWFWEQFAHYKRILMFQVDSIICANSDHVVEDFVEFDLIGAPIKPGMGTGMNGGLSLRNPRFMLKIAQDFKRRVAADPNVAKEVDFEDQWFFRRAREFEGTLPTPEQAGNFSVETAYYPKPFGYHQVYRFQQEHDADIHKYCPEVGMIVKGAHFR